jgi:hypothetical protein
MFTVPDGGARAIPTNVVLKGMLELLPDNEDVSVSSKDACHLCDKAPSCLQHPDKICTMLCMECKVGLCGRCMQTFTRGPHADHQLKDFDDAMIDVRRDVCQATDEITEMAISSTQLCEMTSNNLSTWKSSLEKGVTDRARKAIAKVQQWEKDMLNRIQDFFKEGKHQVQQLKLKFGDANSLASLFKELEKLSGMEASKKFDSLKVTLQKAKSELKVYQNARLVPQETLSDNWSVEMGDIKSKGMLSQITSQNGIYCLYLLQFQYFKTFFCCILYHIKIILETHTDDVVFIYLPNDHGVNVVKMHFMKIQ